VNDSKHVRVDVLSLAKVSSAFIVRLLAGWKKGFFTFGETFMGAESWVS
jgi:hypothetical protein